MTGEHAVGRVIARPFRGEPGRVRAHRGPPRLRVRRRPARSYLEELQDAGVPVHAVGKIARVRRRRRSTQAHGRDQRGGDRRDRAADRRARRAASSSPTSSRPTRSTATATTSRASTRRCRRSTPRSAAGWSGSAPTRPAGPHRRPRLRPDHPGTDHTREHAPLLARFDGTAAAATTGRSPTSAPPRCAG